MSIKVDNNVFELKITPNKRKREHIATKHSNENKENNFFLNNFMEVKSIADLVKQRNVNANDDGSVNNFEIIRKPPKKKSKHDSDGEEHCFVNPALNLNVPEKILNPFEVKRAPIVEEENHCFSNPALNIRTAERDRVNPFEIARDHPPKEIQGIENPGLDIQPTLAIAVPFTPTVGCRIDFNGVSLDALTPCSMLSKKLVFSPVQKPADLTPKRRSSTLSVISEEAVDISKELECYQLELENSMNEAKATKKRGNKNLMDLKRRKSLALRLSEGGQHGENDEKNEKGEAPSTPTTPKPIPVSEPACTAPFQKAIEHSCHQEAIDGRSECPKSSTPKTPNESCIAKYQVDDKSISENPDVVYEEIEETRVEIIEEREEVDVFKNPAPFVRQYRRDVRKPVATKKADEEIGADNQKETKEGKEHKDHEMFGSIRSSIRKSIRKLMHGGSNNDKRSTENLAVDDNQPAQTAGIFSSIRHSLRRKPKPAPAADVGDSVHEVSVIDCKPRPIFKDAFPKAKVNSGESEMDDHVGLFRTSTIIRSSIRKSSRHVMKSVFKKNVEDYNLDK